MVKNQASSGQSIRSCDRCPALRKNGQRCKNKVCNGTMCFSHAIKEKGLRVMKSTVPGLGMGLFAVKTFKKDEIIDKYGGECLSREALDQRYPGDINGDYSLCYGKECVDALRTNDSFSRFANHSFNKKDVTAHLKGTKCNTFRLVATKKIKGTPKNPVEIFTTYGDAYKFG